MSNESMGNKTTSKIKYDKLNIQLLPDHEHRLHIPLSTNFGRYSINYGQNVHMIPLFSNLIDSFNVGHLNLDFLVVSHYLKDIKPKFDISNSGNEPLGFADPS